MKISYDTTWATSRPSRLRVPRAVINLHQPPSTFINNTNFVNLVENGPLPVVTNSRFQVFYAKKNIIYFCVAISDF